MYRACVAIQKIIQVMSTTASREVMPANASAACSDSDSSTKTRTRPRSTDSAMAAPTPVHSRDSACPLLVRTR